MLVADHRPTLLEIRAEVPVEVVGTAIKWNIRKAGQAELTDVEIGPGLQVGTGRRSDGAGPTSPESAIDLTTPGLIFVDHGREHAGRDGVTQHRGASQLIKCRRVLRWKHLDRKPGSSRSNGQLGKVVQIQELFRVMIFPHDGRLSEGQRDPTNRTREQNDRKSGPFPLDAAQAGRPCGKYDEDEDGNAVLTSICCEEAEHPGGGRQSVGTSLSALARNVAQMARSSQLANQTSRPTQLRSPNTGGQRMTTAADIAVGTGASLNERTAITAATKRPTPAMVMIQTGMPRRPVAPHAAACRGAYQSLTFPSSPLRYIACESTVKTPGHCGTAETTLSANHIAASGHQERAVVAAPDTAPQKPRTGTDERCSGADWGMNSDSLVLRAVLAP